MILSKDNLLRLFALCIGFTAGMILFHFFPWSPPILDLPIFTDVTKESDISFQHTNGLSGKYHYPEIMGGGIALFDYDNDGFLDIYFVNGNHLDKKPSPEITNHLYKNNGDFTFTDVTEKAGVADPGFGQGCCAADYDNDGDTDLYLSNFGRNILYRNNGDGTFSDVTDTAGLADPAWGQSSTFLDYNNDGHLDLYVQNYLTYTTDLKYEAYIYIGNKKMPDYPAPSNFPGSQDHLYKNNGNGTFTDVTEEAGLTAPDGRGMGIGCYDMDNDGFTDIFITNDGMENYLFHNNGDGTFEETGLTAGVAFDGLGIPEASMGVDIGDFDGDGLIDMAVPCTRKQVYTLYKNNGNYFSDESDNSGLTQSTSNRTGFNPNFIDFDNDGDLDLFFTTGGVRKNELVSEDASYEKRYGLPDIILANDGQGRFSDVSKLAGSHFQRKLIGRGAVTGDLDNDGDMDIVLSNLGGHAVLLRNNSSPDQHWITFNLIPKTGSRDAIGTEIMIKAGGKTQRTVIHGGVTYLSQIDRRPHFGLGRAETIESLEITWPDKKKQVLKNIASNRFVTIKQ